MTVADVASLDLTTGMTLEAWVSPSAVSDWRTVLMKEQPGGLVYGLYAGADSDGGRARHVFTSREIDMRGTAALAANTWTHLTATYDGDHAAALSWTARGRLAGPSRARSSPPAARFASAATTSGPSGSPA